jgi:hypothetical protein
MDVDRAGCRYLEYILYCIQGKGNESEMEADREQKYKGG